MIEEHLDRAALPLVAAGQEGLAVLAEREAMGEQRGHVQLLLPQKLEVPVEGVLTPPIDFLETKGVGSQERDLLEVEGGSTRSDPAFRRQSPRWRPASA